jgi:hypothetical protein
MSRLTVKGNIVSQKDINKLLEPSNENQFGMNDAYYKLKEYEDLEEQGLLLKLPCKVGDTIYEIVNDEIISFSFQKQWRIARYLEAGIFGKIAFLTKEEAEETLKRLESD